MAALIIGTLLALAALAYVLYPLFVEPRSQAGPAWHPADEPSARAEAADGGLPDDRVEAEIRRARAAVRACESCGPRPEPDAVYCSSCGRYLAGRCAGCGEPVTEPGARFCASCGHTLAA